MPLAPGTRLGPYEIVAPLGAGAMGEVYRARDARLGRDVAIKALPAGARRGHELAHGAEEEAVMLSRGAPTRDAMPELREEPA
jgi:serine/threonine protein kinase